MTVQRNEEEKAREYVVEKGLLVLQLAGHLFREPRRMGKESIRKEESSAVFQLQRGQRATKTKAVIIGTLRLVCSNREDNVKKEPSVRGQRMIPQP